MSSELILNPYIQSTSQINWNTIEIKTLKEMESYLASVKQQLCNATEAPIEMIFPNLKTEEKVFVKRTKVKGL